MSGSENGERSTRFGGITVEQWKTRHDLRESQGRLCILRLLGKHCVGPDGCYYGPGHKPIDHQCWPPHGDHMNLWLDKAGKPVLFTSQPYGLGWKALQETIAFCKKWGLRVDINYPDQAWHNPGGVLMLEFRKAEKD